MRVKGTEVGTSTDAQGKYTLSVPGATSVLAVSFVGYTTQEITVAAKTVINISLEPANASLQEVVVTGYTSQKKESLTAAISSVTSKDIDRVHAGANVSTTLAGKIPGVSFKAAEGRPGASAAISIRNYGPALFVIDGIQQDEGQFNNLAPGDIETITVLKDASASIYGVRAANGVVVVTTKRGKLNEKASLNFDFYTGWQNWTRFPDVLTNSYDYMKYRAEAEVNLTGTTSITPAELEKYKQGTEYGYQSFNWKDFIIKGNAPITNISANSSGGSDKTNYYFSATHVFQNSVLGREFLFKRTNIQSNIESKITDRVKVGVMINGRIETRDNPGVPGQDDYGNAKFAILRNTPLERPFANDNPEYINDIKHNETNWGYLTLKNAGHYREDWRVLQTNFTLDYQIPGIKGLTARGKYSYYLADQLLNNHEYTYKTYTYDPAADTYAATGGSTNPWRERRQRKVINTTLQGLLEYNNTFGKHTINAFLVAERLKNTDLNNWVHAVPTTNVLPLIYFPTVDTYDDLQTDLNRVGYAARVSYNYGNKYYFEGSARRDASSLFAPSARVGYFPSGSVGYRITEEKFIKNLLGDKSVLNDLKLRASYGVLGDDRVALDYFAYIPGYLYNQGTNILDGNAIVGSKDKGAPITNVSWTRSKILDIGIDYSMFNNKLTGAIEYHNRRRTGLLYPRYDVLVPTELGYGLPSENLNSDQVRGFEFSANYTNKFGELAYAIGGNVGYARNTDLTVYKEVFNNSLDRYMNGKTNRYSQRYPGYEVLGQFQTQEEINNYPVNIDGKGNSTLLPGDLIIKDNNGDGRIDEYDRRTIGFSNTGLPLINFGFSITLNYKGFNLAADFSGGAGYTWLQNWETRWPFQNDGNFNTIFEDRWHREDPYDVNSAWIPGKYPALRFNRGGDSNNNNSTADGGRVGTGNNTFFTHNVKYLRARTIELGYSLPKKLLDKLNVKSCRVFVNGYNLFSIDNLSSYGIDPEVNDDNGLQYPQTKIVNVGMKLSL
ncbi:TonB-dependent receptor [Mucilaginibacter gynuensis]|uniref:TonB-dependent receptor n=1 Tax=Mucilaginibacter gynuensis TaxID=1302236 RepID=A0ABP8FLX2_9SPHI